MARKHPQVQEVSYGLYERFDPESKALPKLQSFSTTVPVEVGQEFGYVLRIRHGRGLRIEFEIAHPDVPGDDGAVMAPFCGEQFVRTSDFNFFLGDALWEPLEAMLGEWTLTTRLEDKVVAKRTFEVRRPEILQGWDALPVQ
ncbi:MAG: DUF3859 domain-containing protein [Algisphaera sp.]